MNRSYEVLKEIYRPYKITIKGKCEIFNTTSGNYVIKKRNADLNNLYSYLNSRSFHNFVPLVDSSRSGVNVFKYLEEVNMPLEQKALDLIKVVSNLHNKTSYYKDISSKVYKTIYDNIKGNIVYLDNYYNSLFDEFINASNYLSPAKYLFVRNFYKLRECISFCYSNLDDWYELVKEKTKQRVCLVHNNLRLDHFIKSDEEYLLSFDNYIIDSPILDIIKFYKREYRNLEFSSVLDVYFSLFTLLEDEKLLLFIVMSLPNKIELTSNEFNNTNIVSDMYNYIFKTENLLKSYKSKEEEKK